MKPKALPHIERVKELVEYDKDTGAFTWKTYRGGKAKAGTAAGYMAKNGYLIVCIDHNNCKASRLAWLLVTGQDPGEMDIDHIDGNPSNNAFANLRIATESQNCTNRKRRSDNKSGYKGVYAMGKKWAAQITANKKMMYLGVYDTPELAHQKYLEQAAIFHGEFGRAA
jgi:hypothetical protein